MEHHSEAAKTVADVAAAVTAAGAVLQLLPAVAAGLTIVWYIIRIVEWIREKYKK